MRDPFRFFARACALLAAPIVVIACSSSSGDASGGAANDGGTAGDGATSGGHDGSSGGGGDGGTSGNDASVGGDAGNATAACNAAGDAVCAKLASCSSFGLSATYGDVTTCKRRFVMQCLYGFLAPGTSATPARIDACTASFANLSCADFVAQKFGTACATAPGPLANGTACGEDAQCASTFCARSPTSLCGTCSALTTASGPCVNGSCSQGQSCPSGGTTCVVPTPGAVGDACTVQESCDVAHGVGCNTSSKKCIALGMAAGPGDACGADSITPTKYTLCPASGSCSAVFNGTCAAAAADDASCSTSSTGPHCMAPARCVAGKCTLPAPQSCH